LLTTHLDSLKAVPVDHFVVVDLVEVKVGVVVAKVVHLVEVKPQFNARHRHAKCQWDVRVLLAILAVITHPVITLVVTLENIKSKSLMPIMFHRSSILITKRDITHTYCMEDVSQIRVKMEEHAH